MGLGLLDNVFPGPTGVAAQLLYLFGGEGVVSYSAGDVYDPLTSTTTPGTPISDTVDASPPEAYDRPDIDGTAIVSGDMKTLIREDQLTAIPPINATFTYQGEAWNIVSVNPIISGHEVATYELQLRK